MNRSHREAASQQGMTMLELMVVLVVAVPILGSVLATNRMVREENTAMSAASDVAESCRLAGQRLALYARAGLLSTCAVRATQADIDTATDAHSLDPSIPIPDLGEWISPYEDTSRPTFRFQAADGVLSLNATALTPEREFELALEPTETANGADDDGDGLVDEGVLQLRIGTTRLELISTGVERCEFSLSGRTLTMTLQCARRDHEGHVYRATATHMIYMRNN